MNALDYIIVGQGIAGSCLACEFLKRGRKLVIIDDSWKNAACLVAAGVINPITGQRLVKSWRSELAHPYAKKFYKEAETLLGAQFLHGRKILQLCKSGEEREMWNARKAEDGYAQFIGASFSPKTFSDLNDSFGAFFIERSAWVEPPAAMKAFKKYFEGLGVLRSETFDFAKLGARANPFVEYGALRAKKIVFCEGWKAKENPFFSWLPYRPAKGEILTVRAESKIPEHIIHRGGWIMKCGENLFRAGSTWDRARLDSAPTAEGAQELSNIVRNMIPSLKDAALDIADHGAGVRPCTATTRPHIGVHPNDARLVSFNGFGSKGYALSPYFAAHLAEHLEDGKPLDSEADIKRHVRRFFKP